MFQYDEILVSPGQFLHWRHAMSLTCSCRFVFWALTQFPSWQGHKHCNTRLYCPNRLCKRARSVILQFLHGARHALPWNRSLKKPTQPLVADRGSNLHFHCGFVGLSLPLRWSRPGVKDESWLLVLEFYSLETEIHHLWNVFAFWSMFSQIIFHIQSWSPVGAW